MSIWETLQIESKVLSILDVQPHDPTHHFGRPFLTPYQIAIEFKSRYPSEFVQIGKPVGGRNTGQHDSLAQYIARELAPRIRDGQLAQVEGAFLHCDHLVTLQYDDLGTPVEASITQSSDLSMYRLKA